MSGDLVGSARSIVRDIGQPHPGPPRLGQGVGNPGDRVRAHVDDAVQVDQGDVVVLGGRPTAATGQG
jgi:hypothetical protein